MINTLSENLADGDIVFDPLFNKFEDQVACLVGYEQKYFQIDKRLFKGQLRAKN